MKLKPNCTWTTKTVRIDVDTGEHLTEKEAKKHYQLIKNKKEYIYDKRTHTRFIQLTKLYRSRRQLDLFTS